MELKFWWPNLDWVKYLPCKALDAYLQRRVQKFSAEKATSFAYFVQQMANRLIVGVFRYDKGRPTRKAKYMTRLQAEVKEYVRTGNLEHLYNAANYCYLESEAPEHPNFHFKHRHKSVTRDKLRMKL